MNSPFSCGKMTLTFFRWKTLREISAFCVGILPKNARHYTARDGNSRLLLFCALLDPAFDEIGHRLRNTISLGRHTIVIAIGKHDTHVNCTFAGLARHENGLAIGTLH